MAPLCSTNSIDCKTYFSKNRLKNKGYNKDRKGIFYNDKGINPNDITFVNTDVPSVGWSKYIKQIFMNIKGEINNNMSE